MHFIATIKRRKTVRKLLALGFLVVLFAEIGVHAALDNNGDFEAPNAWTNCFLLHQTSPSADCPHKRHPFGPHSSAADQVSHHWALMPEFSFPSGGFSYEIPSVERDPLMIVTRAMSPPFVPPKQV